MKKIISILFSILAAVISATATAPRVQLLICQPGSEIYELEGHAGLRIEHPLYGDFVVNWGVFDFDSPGFVWRFVKGETDYLAAAYPTPLFVESYARQGRPVNYLTLNLDSVQTERLITLVAENLRPENRVYRYNYVLDNCATRPLDIIEKAVGGDITLCTTGTDNPDCTTFRNIMRRYHRNYPWYQFGIDIALGSGIDRPLSPFEPRFAPALALGMIFAAASCVSVLQLRGRRLWGRVFDTAYFCMTGLCGLVLTFLIFISVHEATSPNWLYLWLNPLCFIGAAAVWLKRGKVLEISYQSVNFALLIILAVIFLTGVQSPNPAFWPLIAASALRAITNILTRCSKSNR
ncbi:MAG: DUF4105 domain-containing protein [Muribaculaceae bacterium]|nr:DUF4105 domain-containing protein [Muribaculaceae bacterium]